MAIETDNPINEEVDVEQALDNAHQVDADISNNNEALASKEENLVDKFKKDVLSREHRNFLT